MFGFKIGKDECDDTVYLDTDGGCEYEEYDSLRDMTEEKMNKDLNREVIVFLSHAREILEEKAVEYFWSRFNADPEWQTYTEGFHNSSYPWGRPPGIDSISIDPDRNVEIKCSRVYQDGDGHYRTYTFPTRYLWENQAEILADIQAKAEAKARAEKARKQKAEEARKKQVEADERKVLADLKAKYPEEVA